MATRRYINIFPILRMTIDDDDSTGPSAGAPRFGLKAKGK